MFQNGRSHLRGEHIFLGNIALQQSNAQGFCIFLMGKGRSINPAARMAPSRRKGKTVAGERTRFVTAGMPARKKADLEKDHTERQAPVSVNRDQGEQKENNPPGCNPESRRCAPAARQRADTQAAPTAQGQSGRLLYGCSPAGKRQNKGKTGEKQG